MAEYIYKEMTNEIGWGTTFNPAGRAPVIGSRIFPSLSELNTYITLADSTAIAGIICAVVNDPVSDANNGLYQIEFIHTDWTEEFTRDGQTITNVVCYNTVGGAPNLRAVKLINTDNQGGIEGGAVVDGFYTTISGVERFVYKSGNNYYYYDDQGQQQSYTYQGETVHTYIELTLTNGEKVRIDADELKGVTDTYVVSGQLREDTENNELYIDLYYNTDPQAATAPVSINVTDLIPTQYGDSVVTYNTVVGTLNATTGLFNNAAVNVIKEYIDDFDCGSFDLNP